MELIDLQYWDNTKSKIRLFKSPNATMTFIMLPAMGTKARYYEIFAERLNREGYQVVIADWRGHGDFDTRASRKVNFGYKELVQDIGSLVEYLNHSLPNTQKIILGHSLGGQLGSLFASRYPDQIDALILIASCLVYYKGWEGFEATKVLMAVNLFPLICNMVGYFPGKKIGFAGREAKQVMKDWSLNGRTGKYILFKDAFDYEASLATLEKDILAFSMDKDYMAPKKAVENLLDKYNNQSKITHLHVGSEETNIEGLNHFNWAKNPDYFVNEIKNWELNRT